MSSVRSCAGAEWGDSQGREKGRAETDRKKERKGGRERLASTRRDRSLIFRRKVLALSKSWWRHPKEEDNIWCCLHQQPTLSPTLPVQPPLLARGVKETRLQLFLYPPSYCLPLLSSYLVLSYTAYHATTIRFIQISPALAFPSSPFRNLRK